MKAKILNLFIVYLLLSSCGIVNPGIKTVNSQPEISVLTYQQQIPVLKLKKDNPVLRICISKDNYRKYLKTETITIHIKGSDIINDIKAARIWFSGNDSVWKEYSSMELFGHELKPDVEISF